ncbi:SAM-dependent methyltransferase [Nocardiopsis gilva YIM 90087]|uniref:SAM-dependent methyltransferase n=1 Tax=Nocardiopsis gilva YIM 90087 TaxID=1235441 RepID=A0A223S3Y8_9ACTN|nr:class I SAM-dependent methyltransferase [Nocardiopsis gilva]ASU82835.1 SAM-dependent methyltransferase [Nocardiopsis gilva YIM 90087]
MGEFFGISKAIYDLKIPNTVVTPIYEGFHGYVYGGLVEHSEADIGVIKTWVGGRARRVLDLCCGTGRFARRLAADGHDVVGVDASPDMVAGAGERWRSSAPEVPGKAVFKEDDATDMDLGESFDAVVIGGLSISTFATEERNSLLRVARRHVGAGGSLVFDYMPFPDSEDADESYHVFPFPGESDRAFMVLAVLQDPQRGVQVTNMYSELIDGEGGTRRILSSESVSYLSDEAIREELAVAGFKVVEGKDTTPEPPSGKRLPRVTMLRCEAV